MNPRAILSRGYALCRDVASGRFVSSAQTALSTKSMTVTFHDGSVLTEVKEVVDDGQAAEL